nr:DUF438 domain-containing protein [Candidatus Freyrarchaeum guaymaensis]
MSSSGSRKEMLKELLRRLHSGFPPSEVKEEFKEFLKDVGPLEIAEIEQELIKEGVPREELQKLCEVHLAIFKEQLEKQELDVPPEHPLGILVEEHRILLKMANELGRLAGSIRKAEDKDQVGDVINRLSRLSEELLDAKNHYLREENVLFPVLEKHGVTEPPAIMWMEHDQIRRKKKELHELVSKFQETSLQDFKEQLSRHSEELSAFLSSHFFKENNLLFPVALRVITDGEWNGIREGFDEIGYCCFTPPDLLVAQRVKSEKEAEKGAVTGEGVVNFETGGFSREELEAVLNTLPVDITFVDKDDVVKYFNKGEERIFVRTKAVIGRRVQMCHPQKSVHVVNRILEAFKKGERDVAEFWIQVGGRLVYIRYLAVRDKKGQYLGTLEVTQDITDIKKIEGEKRLLDWEAPPSTNYH